MFFPIFISVHFFTCHWLFSNGFNFSSINEGAGASPDFRLCTTNSEQSKQNNNISHIMNFRQNYINFTQNIKKAVK